MNCDIRHDLKIIRGDSLPLLVGLARGWADVALSPHHYIGRLVLREQQDDTFPHILRVDAKPTPAEDHRFPEMDYLLDLSLLPDQTKALPDWPLVCFCELRSVDGTYVKRLWQGQVRMGD